MADTLKIADDKRLHGLQAKVTAQAMPTGLMLAAMAALFRQLLVLRGEISSGIARLDERLAGIQRTVDQRFEAIERRLPPP